MTSAELLHTSFNEGGIDGFFCEQQDVRAQVRGSGDAVLDVLEHDERELLSRYQDDIFDVAKFPEVLEDRFIASTADETVVVKNQKL